MAKIQFRVLYREFLFRMVDLELVSARGDINKLLGQFAAMLAALSLLSSLGGLRYSNSQMPGRMILLSSWADLHFLIANTMVVVGLFTVLCWDSTFPDQRDVLVLAPLPVRSRTLFLAKVAALITALSATVFAVNVFTGLTYPLALGLATSGLLGIVRSFFAYWITMLAAGAFLLCAVLAVQGAAAQLLTRRRFLRLSAFLQLTAFCLILSVYFLEPTSWATPKALTAPEHQRALAWLPTYWFVGLFHRLNGSMHPALEPLTRRALTGLGLVVCGAIAGFVLSYFRTLRKIVEEPDIGPGSRGRGWSWRFGDSLQTAVALFSVRSLLRSRQHRVIFAGYLGIGLAISLAYLKGLMYGNTAWRQVNRPLLVASIVMLCFAAVGMRAVFSLPLALRANWIFRITAVRAATDYMGATRRSFLLLAAAPVLTSFGALFLSIWPPWQAAAHLPVLAILGLILADLRLYGFQKIPFTCSYLPGKGNVHVTSGAYIIVLTALADEGVRIELRALRGLTSYIVMLAVLGAVAFWARRRTANRAKAPEVALQFEDAPPADIHALDLHRDGMLLG